MIKPVKKNKRLKWIDSRYSRPYKARLFFRRVQAMQIVTAGLSRNISIARSGYGISIGLGIAMNVLDTSKSLSKLFRQPLNGRTTNEH